jgi:hypothetical protein
MSAIYQCSVGFVRHLFHHRTGLAEEFEIKAAFRFSFAGKTG